VKTALQISEGSLSNTIRSTIFVLTDTPAIYGSDLNRDSAAPVFVKDIETLITELKKVDVAGLVLEVHKVMKASRRERDRLFSFAGTFPVMRAKLNPRHGFVTYLDPRDSFFANLEAAIGKKNRSYKRKAVNLTCNFSHEDDPSMAVPQEAEILDISPGGCFIHTHHTPDDEHFLHLCIPQLGCTRPIFSSIRWTRQDTDDSRLCGMGVMFIDISEEQMKSIEAYQPS